MPHTNRDLKVATAIVKRAFKNGGTPQATMAVIALASERMTRFKTSDARDSFKRACVAAGQFARGRVDSLEDGLASFNPRPA